MSRWRDAWDVLVGRARATRGPVEVVAVEPLPVRAAEPFPVKPAESASPAAPTITAPPTFAAAGPSSVLHDQFDSELAVAKRTRLRVVHDLNGLTKSVDDAMRRPRKRASKR
jgi:hypothetical protein